MGGGIGPGKHSHATCISAKKTERGQAARKSREERISGSSSSWVMCSEFNGSPDPYRFSDRLQYSWLLWF